MGELTEGKADISLFPLFLIDNRPDYIDMTYSYLDGGTTILVPKGTYHPSVLGFLAPFSWQVSISIYRLICCRPLRTAAQTWLAVQPDPCLTLMHMCTQDTI